MNNEGQLNDRPSQVDNQKGNFTQVPNEVIEYLMNRKKAELTSREYAVAFFLIRELQGWDYKYKPIEIQDFSEGTGMAARHVLTALKSLVEDNQIISKVKIPGFRTPLYGFNSEKIGRVLVTNEPRNYFKQNSKVIDLVTFKVINSVHPNVIESITQKRRLAAIGAAERVSKDTLNTPKDKISKDLRDFLLTQRKQNRDRWEAIIQRVVTEFPNDEFLLWSAIELVNRTRQDLFGRPIRRSIIGLFEGDWQIMRTAMQAKLAQLEANAIKEKRKEANQLALEETKKHIQSIPDHPIVTQLDPKWARFATLKSIEK